MGLELIKYVFTDINLFKDKIKEIIYLFEELNNKDTVMEYFEVVIRYIMNAKEGINEDELVKIANQVSSERGEAVMTIAEKLRMEGKQEGIKEGITEGKMERNIEIAKNMLRVGMDIEQIMKVTEMEEEKIKLLKEEIKH